MRLCGCGSSSTVLHLRSSKVKKQDFGPLHVRYTVVNSDRVTVVDPSGNKRGNASHFAIPDP